MAIVATSTELVVRDIRVDNSHPNPRRSEQYCCWFVRGNFWDELFEGNTAARAVDFSKTIPEVVTEHP